jgi:hypothetical protein
MLLDQGSKIRDPGRINIRIQDKHPGSATLLKYLFLGCGSGIRGLFDPGSGLEKSLSGINIPEPINCY